MKYTEKADIAAKAVKVLDSVTMKRQSDVAKIYANRAISRLLSDKDEKRSMNQKSFSGFTLAAQASPAIGMIEVAIDQMEARLNKPRYTLKDGGWVRKDHLAELEGIRSLGSVMAKNAAKLWPVEDRLEAGSDFKGAEYLGRSREQEQKLHNIQMANLAGLANAYPSRIAGRASYSHSPVQAEWN